MFLNKNNKFLNKFQKGGEEDPNQAPNPALNPALNPAPIDANQGLNPAPIDANQGLNQGLNPAPIGQDQSPIGQDQSTFGQDQSTFGQDPSTFGQDPSTFGQDPNMFSGNESYPNEDYLYDKITSQETQNNIKIYICAFTINKELDTHFVKYIVQQKDSVVTLPFFEFTSGQNAPMTDQQPMFGQNEIPPQPQMDQQPMFGQPPMDQPPMGQPPMGQPPMGQPPMDQPPMGQPPMDQQPPMGQPPMDQLPMGQPPMDQQPMLGQKPMFGGFKDNSNEEKDLDKMFKTKVSEFVKSIYQNASEPSYMGYIPNVSETGSVFVFVKIETFGQLNPEYIESIPNEIVFLSKVYNFDIDQPLKDLFANNTWLYMKQSLASPFSGYICKQNFVNVAKEDTENVYDQFLINHEGMGNYYYFSFLPVDAQNAGTYQRFALFPVEYDCILDDNNLEYYKQNISSFEQSDSVYFKDGVLGNTPFFALKTPTQFAKI